MNAYILFSKEKRAEIIQQNPELKSKFAEIAKLIGNHWKEMTSEEKSKYVKMAEANKKMLNSEMQNKKKEWQISMEVCSRCNKPFDKNVQWKDFGINGKYCLECAKKIKKRTKFFGIILVSIMISLFIIIICSTIVIKFWVVK